MRNSLDKVIGDGIELNFEFSRGSTSLGYLKKLFSAFSGLTGPKFHQNANGSLHSYLSQNFLSHDVYIKSFLLVVLSLYSI